MKKIVIFDDNLMSGNIFIKSLKKYDFACELVFENMLSAVDKITPDDVSLILLDIIMPEISGYEILKIFREKYGEMELPIIMVTSKRESGDIVKAFELGANDYVVKPVIISEAISRIKTQLKLIEMSDQISKNKVLESINSMVITYNHEINNPLTIAMGNLPDNFESKWTEKNYNNMKEALVRIQKIVKEISRIADEDILVEEYSKNQKMIKIK